jgi:hypothetical protein
LQAAGATDDPSAAGVGESNEYVLHHEQATAADRERRRIPLLAAGIEDTFIVGLPGVSGDSLEGCTMVGENPDLGCGESEAAGVDYGWCEPGMVSRDSRLSGRFGECTQNWRSHRPESSRTDITSASMTEQSVPESRTYRHAKCGQDTVVSGQAFEVVSNPMSSMEQTQCSSCGAMFPITDFAWSDTGETISDYYARHSTSATPMQRFLCTKTFMVAVIAICIVATEVGIYFLLARGDRFVLAFCLAGGLVIGAIIGMAVFVSGFADPIKRKVCGVRDTRSLT